MQGNTCQGGLYTPPPFKVFTLPLVFRPDPRGIPRNPLIPGHQFFGVLWLLHSARIRVDPHGMMQNLDPFRTDPWNLLGLFRAKYSSHGRGLFFVRVRTDYI